MTKGSGIRELSVKEARHRDADRSIARVNREDMEALGLLSGDIIEIQGKDTVPAIVWPGYPEDSGNGCIRIDGNLRNNAGVGINGKVNIKKIRASDARKITLAATKEMSIVRASEYLSKMVEGRPLRKGQNIRVEMLGESISFIVVGTDPDGPVIVTKDTEVVLKEEPSEEARVITSYEDIGGLKREMQLVREMIELPLRHSELFKAIGIEPPKGVLLYGPPGTGKTLLAKAVANECEANFYLINGPEIIARYYGESEERLRQVFEEAEANAPSIIFIDEIDSIAPKRGELTGERMVERRVVSTLLTLMDGLKTRGNVVVIGATNQPDILDEALRRGGRFDREIEIGIPDKEGRLEILYVHTRGMPLANDVKLKEIASITHGFVGADLSALCKEAGMHALRKIMAEKGDKVTPETCLSMGVTMADFYEALKVVEPSAMRELAVEIPDIRWDDIGGLKDVKQELVETVVWPLKYPYLYEYSNTRVPKGILLHGHPGNGKTLLAKAIANESGINFISIKGPELISKYVGESEKRLREMFRRAKQSSPCILFFDELDAVAQVRGEVTGEGGVSERFISQLLTEMDGVEDLKDVLVLAATNRLDLIDPALLRPGRFDRLVEIPAPDGKTRKEILSIHCKGKPLTANINLQKLAKDSEGFSGADIGALCSIASKYAIRDFIKGRKESQVKKDYQKFKIDAKYFKEALKEMKSRKGKGNGKDKEA